jgi:hypothetical protein
MEIPGGATHGGGLANVAVKCGRSPFRVNFSPCRLKLTYGECNTVS